MEQPGHSSSSSSSSLMELIALAVQLARLGANSLAEGAGQRAHHLGVEDGRGEAGRTRCRGHGQVLMQGGLSRPCMHSMLASFETAFLWIIVSDALPGSSQVPLHPARAAKPRAMLQLGHFGNLCRDDRAQELFQQMILVPVLFQKHILMVK